MRHATEYRFVADLVLVEAEQELCLEGARLPGPGAECATSEVTSRHSAGSVAGCSSGTQWLRKEGRKAGPGAGSELA